MNKLLSRKPKMRQEYGLVQYREINLPKEEKDKAKILEKYKDKQVLVKDFHYTDNIDGNLILGGVLNFNPEDPEVYELSYDTEELKNEKRRFHTHDLEGLLVKIR